MGLNTLNYALANKKVASQSTGYASYEQIDDTTVKIHFTNGDSVTLRFPEPTVSEAKIKEVAEAWLELNKDELHGEDGKTVFVGPVDEAPEEAVLIFDPDEIVGTDAYTKVQSDVRFAKAFEVGDVSKLAVSTWKDLVEAINTVWLAGMGAYKFEVDETKKQLTIVTRGGVEIPIDIAQIILNTNIEEFKDMLVTNLLDGQSLVYSASKKKWVNKSIDSSGMLVEAKKYTDDEIKKFNNKGSLAVDEKPTYYGGIITYKQGGETKTTDNAGTWFYYFDENAKAVQTIYIEGTEFTIAMAGDINLDDYVPKTQVTGDFVENPVDKSLIPNLEYIASMRDVIIGALGRKVNSEDVVDDLGFEGSGITTFALVSDSKIPNVKALRQLHSLLFSKFLQLKNIIAKNDTETASTDETVYSSAKVDDLLDNVIDDESESEDSTWSSSKINANLVKLNDSVVSENSTYSSQKIHDSFVDKVPFKFGITEDGQYGYYKAGADSVTPFSNGFQNIFVTGRVWGTPNYNLYTDKSTTEVYYGKETWTIGTYDIAHGQWDIIIKANTKGMYYNSYNRTTAVYDVGETIVSIGGISGASAEVLVCKLA